MARQLLLCSLLFLLQLCQRGKMDYQICQTRLPPTSLLLLPYSNTRMRFIILILWFNNWDCRRFHLQPPRLHRSHIRSIVLLLSRWPRASLPCLASTAPSAAVAAATIPSPAQLLLLPSLQRHRLLQRRIRISTESSGRIPKAPHPRRSPWPPAPISNCPRSKEEEEEEMNWH